MKIVNFTPNILKENLDIAIQKAVADYLADYKLNNPYFSHKRVLTMDKVINLLLSMQGGSLKKELYDAGINVTASAFVQQRNKIPWMFFEEVFEHFNSMRKDTKTYKGYRVLAIDGTTVNMSRNPKSVSYVKNEGSPKGYNQLHVNPLYDVLNKTYQHCIIQPQPQQDEVGALTFMMGWYEFKEKTLIVVDRGYESYNAFAHLQKNPNTDFLIRVKQDRSAMREIGKLPMTELDTDVSFTITTTQTKEDKENGYVLLQTRKTEDRVYSSKTRAGRWDFPSPYPMKFRVVRFQLETGEYETLVTSLPRSITLEEIKELYHARWGIETAFRELKYGLGLVNLHGKKDDFVMQEIFSAMIMSNFCSRVVNEVVVRKNDANIHEYKVNMNMAIHICRQFFRTKNADEKQLLRDIARYTEPVRPGRRDERNIKAKSFVGFIYRVSA
ncbi:MAG: IS4 family transposase [Roseburia sp.]